MAVRVQEAAFAWDREILRANQARLAALHAAREPGLSLINAHDPHLLREA